jgi:hypothetical protein
MTKEGHMEKLTTISITENDLIADPRIHLESAFCMMATLAHQWKTRRKKLFLPLYHCKMLLQMAVQMLSRNSQNSEFITTVVTLFSGQKN